MVSVHLLKDSADVDLVKAVEEAVSGRSFFSPAIARVMLDDYRRQLTDRGVSDRYEILSEREREIFQLIAEAKANKEIAALLNVSTSTVETHRAHIMEKLDLHSAAEIVLYAVRRGVIRIDQQGNIQLGFGVVVSVSHRVFRSGYLPFIPQRERNESRV